MGEWQQRCSMSVEKGRHILPFKNSIEAAEKEEWHYWGVVSDTLVLKAKMVNVFAMKFEHNVDASALLLL